MSVLEGVWCVILTLLFPGSGEDLAGEEDAGTYGRKKSHHSQFTGDCECVCGGV